MTSVISRIFGSAAARALVVVLATACVLAVSAPPVASACGGFFRSRTTKTVPSLQVEQVLILHDPETEQEHFIRELVFRDAKEPFGFVVPTPSQPTVAKVDTSPFVSLARTFPPEPPPPPAGGGGLAGIGKGSGAGAGAGSSVTVLSRERIGSFTVFVLAATDAGALKKWLDDNQLATTPESDAWLAHYVKHGFYYAAFRYEMPAAKDAGATAKSETVRISFATPLPYYPYKEPEHATAPPKLDRVLAVWLVSPARSVPVAALTEGTAASWKRPWAEPRKHRPQTTSFLGTVVGAQLEALLASDASRVWDVQTFEDQKSSRRGWGDVVLVPDAPRPADAKKLERTQKLMTCLEPTVGAP
jgi:Uncharacterized protein conserved in bacteria (DUF2330)